MTSLSRFSLLFSIWLAVYFSSVQSMISVWSSSKTYEHGMLIAPIALWLAFRKREQYQQTPNEISFLPLLLMFLPTAFWVMGKAANIALFEHAASILSLQLLIWFCIGNARAKILAFPIFYLAFCVPFGEEFIPSLQIITADITVFLLQLSSIPIYREGLFLTIPNGLFEVAEACSGIRFLVSSIALGFLFSYLSFNKWYKHASFIAFTLVFPIIANGIRAYGIVIVGYLSDMKYAAGADHLVYGWVFFSFVILSIFYVANKFSDIPTKSKEKLSIQKFPASMLKQNILFLSLTCLFIFQLLWLNTLHSSNETKAAPINIPDYVTILDHSHWGVDFPNAEQAVLLEHKEAKTQIYIANSQTRAFDKEFIHYNNRLFDQKKWSLVSSKTKTLSNNTKVNITQIVDHSGNQQNLIHWYCINARCTNSRSQIKLLQAIYIIANQPFQLRFTAILTEDAELNEEILQANMLDFHSRNKKVDI